MCIDYRKLNEKIVKTRYPLPIMEDQIDRLRGAKIFSTIDLKNGFFMFELQKIVVNILHLQSLVGILSFCACLSGSARRLHIFRGT